MNTAFSMHDTPPDPLPVPPEEPFSPPLPQPVTPDGLPIEPIGEPTPIEQPPPMREPPFIRPPMATGARLSC